MTAILILLLIGSLSGSWMLSGVIPAMIYYGVDIMHPSYFLVASVVLCAIVSLATGSSWSTIATVGVAIVGVGNAFGLHQGLVAGAVISGAYFGDKMSPLSDRQTWLLQLQERIFSLISATWYTPLSQL